jgi:hypothetical protein
MVMEMYALLEETSQQPTAVQVEAALDGHICRCTGFRGILDAFTSLAVPADVEDPLTPSPPSSVFEVVGGFLHTCARLENGSVWCWGSNFNNNVGVGTGQTPLPTAILEAPDGLGTLTPGHGNTTSLVAGNCPVGLYNANSWIGGGFLNRGSNSEPVTESHAVQNHSWVGTLNANFTEADATEINRRLDFAINRDGFVSVVGVNNGNSTILPAILGQSYHTISVGRDDNGHSAGFTTLDFITSGDAGRIKPDIVAPSAAPEYATSWTTPMVASAAGLLYSKLAAAPYSLAGADKPRVIKSLLLATATKNTVPSWSNTPTRPLDLRYGAGELNICHAYNALRAGKETASSSILRKSLGWATESVAASSPKTYFFNIAAGAPSTPFSAALTWHRVITDNLNGPSWGNLSTTLANLNLRLYQASGFALGSEVAASLSSVDNVELVYQSALPPGNYALVVESTSTTSTHYALAWHSLPAVTVAATSATAREIDLQAGLVTITRTGDTALPLFVPITVGGSAISGSWHGFHAVIINLRDVRCSGSFSASMTACSWSTPFLQLSLLLAGYSPPKFRHWNP